jgi:hypothetical protein
MRLTARGWAAAITLGAMVGMFFPWDAMPWAP